MNSFLLIQLVRQAESAPQDVAYNEDSTLDCVIIFPTMEISSDQHGFWKSVMKWVGWGWADFGPSASLSQLISSRSF